MMPMPALESAARLKPPKNLAIPDRGSASGGPAISPAPPAPPRLSAPRTFLCKCRSGWSPLPASTSARKCPDPESSNRFSSFIADLRPRCERLRPAPRTGPAHAADAKRRCRAAPRGPLQSPPWSALRSRRGRTPPEGARPSPSKCHPVATAFPARGARAQGWAGPTGAHRTRLLRFAPPALRSPRFGGHEHRCAKQKWKLAARLHAVGLARQHQKYLLHGVVGVGSGYAVAPQRAPDGAHVRADARPQTLVGIGALVVGLPSGAERRFRVRLDRHSAHQIRSPTPKPIANQAGILSSPALTVPYIPSTFPSTNRRTGDCQRRRALAPAQNAPPLVVGKATPGGGGGPPTRDERNAAAATRRHPPTLRPCLHCARPS